MKAHGTMETELQAFLPCIRSTIKSSFVVYLTFSQLHKLISCIAFNGRVMMKYVLQMK
jgi:hypothetical protein